MTEFVPDPDITRIVRDLNLTARGDVPREKGPSESGDLERLLAWAAERGASDLFLVSASEPVVRIDGGLVLVEGPILSGEDLGLMVRSLLDAPTLEQLGDKGSRTALEAALSTRRLRTRELRSSPVDDVSDDLHAPA